MKIKFGVLGSSGIYTKILCKQLDVLGVEYVLIMEKKTVETDLFFSKAFSFLIKLDKLLNSGKYKGLSKFGFFTFRLLIEDFIYKKSFSYKSLINSYEGYIPKTKQIYYTPGVNHIETAKIIEKLELDIGLFGGVGIVSGLIIEKFNKFCLNAHPAPLPECRGAGALENTLYYKLDPSVSVHFGTAGIDEGEIIRVEKLSLSKNDNFQLIGLRLTVLCAESLARVVQDIILNKKLEYKKNDGKIHYWKDCDIIKQKESRSNLKKLLKGLSS